MIIIHKILAQNIFIDSVYRGSMMNDYLSFIVVEFKLNLPHEMLMILTI